MQNLLGFQVYFAKKNVSKNFCTGMTMKGLLVKPAQNLLDLEAYIRKKFDLYWDKYSQRRLN